MPLLTCSYKNLYLRSIFSPREKGYGPFRGHVDAATAVDGGRLSAAAREMRVPISTLSRKVAELEAFLGTKLLIRTTRNLTLTDAGISYVAAVRRILEEVEEAERDAAGEFQTPRGTLVITVLTMAHAILRQGGVDVGKMAFPGPINLVEI